MSDRDDRDYGIDYGMGNANLDKVSGIRFGVINANKMNEYVHEAFEADYGPPTCGDCGNSLIEYDDEKHNDYDDCRGCDDFACEGCEKIVSSDDAYDEDPLGWTLDDGEYMANMSSDDGDIFVLSSPYYTHAQFCSPCAPGACYLTNPTDDSGPKCYCFAADWFSDDSPCPYPVYRVSDDRRVYTPKSEEDTPEDDTDEEETPQEDDYSISDTGPLGSLYSVGRYEGKYLGTFRTWDECIRAIREDMEGSNWFPTVWRISDHGNVSIVDMTKEVGDA